MPESPQHPSARAIWTESLVVWVVMLALLGLEAAMAHVVAVPYNTVIALLCAAVELLLVGTFGMQLIRAGTLLRLAAITGAIWLCIMFGLTLNDYLTRGF